MQVPIKFDDVAVYFSESEWGYLGEGQKLLYRDVMMENYQTLNSLELRVVPYLPQCTASSFGCSGYYCWLHVDPRTHISAGIHSTVVHPHLIGYTGSSSVTAGIFIGRVDDG
ncbi:zinc finger protein 92 homolog [Ascaphus truei]|uniref:zinc finger protein 92 homolog n=1 Tax=Ascaphus truei TaxID=8439 RepID=UPI003F594E6F